MQSPVVLKQIRNLRILHNTPCLIPLPPPPNDLGLPTSCLATFWQLLLFPATFSISSNFLRSEQFLLLSSNSEISEQLLVLKLAFLPYFTMF